MKDSRAPMCGRALGKCLGLGPALLVGAVALCAGAPAAASADQVPCPIPAVLTTNVAIVGLPWQGVVANFWCLTAGDQLTNVTIHWSGGGTSAGVVSYSQPSLQPTTTGAGAPTEELLMTATVTGAHTYEEPSQTPATYVTATDMPSGAQLTEGITTTVLARLTGLPLNVHVRRRRAFDGVVARFVVVPRPSLKTVTATISWGDGSSTIGTYRRQARTLTP